MNSVKEMLEGYVKDKLEFIKRHEEHIAKLKDNIQVEKDIITIYEEAIEKLK